MATLKHKKTVPPGGFWYVQEETKLRMEDENLDLLVAKVVSHRIHKGLDRIDRDGVKLEIERQICQRLTEDQCQREGPEDPWNPVRPETVTPLKVTDVMKASAALFKWFVTGREMVSQEEANRRAAICQACPLNLTLSGCKCSIFYKTVAKLVAGDRNINGLGVCGVCGCSLKALVNLPEAAILESHEGRKLDFPQWCWQKQFHDEKAKAQDLPA